MKKITYISLFVFLGILVSFLIHGILEIIAIEFLLADFDRYNLGLSWAQWFSVHKWGSWLLLLLSVGAGFWQGKHWWHVLYEKSGMGE